MPHLRKKINYRVARFNVTFTVFFLIVFATTGSFWFMAIDFLLRGTSFTQYSLIGITSKQIVKMLPFETQLINAGPKIFAARIGLTLSSVVMVATALELNVLALIFASVLGLFSLLEGVFRICVACIIYPLVYKLTYKLNYNSQ